MEIKKLIAAAAAALALAGCKIQIVVPEGGRVVTESGSMVCEAGETCVVDVSDFFFDETFIPEPDEGMMFAGWEKRHRGFCGNSKDPCRLLTTQGFEGDPNLTAVLESAEQEFHLNPTWAVDDGSGDTVGCEFTQSTPGGEFPVCAITALGDQASCDSVAGASFGDAGVLTDADCTEGAIGYCETSFGDLYYHEGDQETMAMGCNFLGTWHEL
ncbi:hypothetical protein EY643_12940 [Halioglobus maricola]|uniref:Bacterial repeat domain-containing protein n=1 Tax=Halioglobus maricola TaxID=2601894 RepID=A0A5P9NKX0_9GAMM|nr:hypothetical protein [Halioglobus maricola]QFU76490.1 hypothetical protein EY643_12940 [Halioglobus maricola]